MTTISMNRKNYIADKKVLLTWPKMDENYLIQKLNLKKVKGSARGTDKCKK